MSAHPSTQHGDGSTLIVCRYGEIFLKQGNRQRFIAKLESNIRRMLDDLSVQVTSSHTRIMVRVPTVAPPGTLAEACLRLERVFGLVSLSPGIEAARTLDGIAECALAQVRSIVPARAPGLTFKVETRRADKTFAHTSQTISAAVGARIQSELGLPVDVHRPALTVRVEVPIGARPVVSVASHPGPGGLPVGTGGRALVLLSGGIDSPVAAWLSAKRGLALDAVYFHSPPFVGEKTRDKILDLARILHRYQAMDSVFIVHFTEIQKKLRAHGRTDLTVLLYRRMMMRIADRIAERTGASALVTGENLGQVASQTVHNLTVTQDAARRIVLRPLVTYDKAETIALARRIGTFALSTLPYDDCCTLFVPPHPATAARVEDAVASEATIREALSFDFEAEAERAAQAAERVVLPGNRPAG